MTTLNRPGNVIKERPCMITPYIGCGKTRVSVVERRGYRARVIEKKAARPIENRIMNVINDKNDDSKIQDCEA